MFHQPVLGVLYPKRFFWVLANRYFCVFFVPNSLGEFQEPKLEVPIPYIRPIFKAYVRGYTRKIWPNIRY